MAIAGVGNSVFHPADYSLISSSISGDRLGRAFSIHTFVGHVGFLIGPTLSATLEPVIGWQGALMTIGTIGIVMSLVMIVFGYLITERKQGQGAGEHRRQPAGSSDLPPGAAFLCILYGGVDLEFWHYPVFRRRFSRAV